MAFSRSTATLARRGLRRLSHHAAAPASDWDYDVLIVGGGVVGATLACRLADELSAARIGLIEARRPQLPPSATTGTGVSSDGPADASLRNALLACGRTPQARVYALSPASVKTLQRCGAWEAIEQSGAAPPFRRMQVWDGPSAAGGLSGHITFDASSQGVPELGVIAEDFALHASLLARLDELHAANRIELLCPAQLERVAFSPPGTGGAPPGPAVVTLRTSGGGESESVTTELRARLVVAADGANSRVRATRGLASWGWGYGQRAIVTTVRAHAPAVATPAPTATAWQRFLANGPLALLPLWDDHYSIVWSTTPDEAARLSALSPAAFVDELNAALGESPPLADSFPFAQMAQEDSAVFRSPPIVESLQAPRLAFDLQLQQASVYCGARTALVGDAAHSIHPMAGQGLNLGLADCESLTRALVHGAEAGLDLGDRHLLEQYDRERRPANLAMMAGLDGLHRLFRFGGAAAAAASGGGSGGAGGWGAHGGAGAAVALARNMGLSALNSATPAKAVLAKFAMGL